MSQLLNTQNICFLGAGSIAEAIMRGLLDKKQATGDHLYVVNKRNAERLAELEQRYKVQVSVEQSDKDRFLREADIIVLAMKPNDVKAALAELKPLLNEQQLLISVVAGLSIATISDIVQLPLPIVRSMPNTSSTIGLGATGICFSAHVQPQHEHLAQQLFEAIGIVSIVDEAEINTVTGISGSGPAYIYYMIEAMVEAGVEGGLSEEQALQLTVQTVLGAAEMLNYTKEQPAVLRQKVTSPGGTTQAALDTLKQLDFAPIVKRAVHRAAERAKQLGDALNE